MTAMQIIFLATSAIILFSALMVVTRRNMVHAALFLVATSFGIAVLYVLLEAPYLAVVQVLIYIGAIAIMMIIAIMLTRRVASDDTVAVNRNAIWAALLSVLLFSSLVIMLQDWPQFSAETSAISRPGVADNDLGGVLVSELGQAIFSPQAYVVPMEVAGILLLAAMIGAFILAWPRISERLKR